ncbi:MAG TPA: tetratricopeptide repeat protein [Chroococcales cyanobacterium]
MAEIPGSILSFDIYKRSGLPGRVASLISVSAVCVFLSSCTLMNPPEKSWTDYLSLANAAKTSGDYATAEDDYKKAVAAAKKKNGADDGSVANCLGYLGEIYFEKQEWREADEVYAQMIPILERFEPNTTHLKERKEEWARIKKKLKEYGLDKNGDETGGDGEAAQTKPTKPAKNTKPAHHKGKAHK